MVLSLLCLSLLRHSYFASLEMVINYAQQILYHICMLYKSLPLVLKTQTLTSRLFA